MLRDIDHGFGAPPHLHGGGGGVGGGGAREGAGCFFFWVLFTFFSASFFAFFFSRFSLGTQEPPPLAPSPPPPCPAPPLPSKFCIRLFSGCFRLFLISGFGFYLGFLQDLYRFFLWYICVCLHASNLLILGFLGAGLRVST